MRKRLSVIVLLFLSVLVVLSSTAPSIHVNEKNNSIFDSQSLLVVSDSNQSNVSIIVLEDGSYIEIETFYEDMTSVLLSSTSIQTDAYTKTGTKNVTMYRPNGTKLWNYFLTGDFRITPGVSAIALNSSYTVTNYSSGWKFSNGSSYTNGNRIEGRGTFKHVVLFVTIKNVYIEISLVADTSGNIK